MNLGGRPAAGRVVAVPLHCRRCGYNLYRLPADGACPECGLETWESILHTVDPTASKLPTLSDPALVGRALLWLMVCAVAATVLSIARPLALWLDGLDPAGLRNLARWTPPALNVAAALAAVAALWAVAKLAPRNAGSGAAGRRDVRLLGAGLAGWAATVIAAYVSERVGTHEAVVQSAWLAGVVAATVTLVGLRGVLQLIGLRSRVYRNARGGRQGIRAMIAAMIGIGIGQVLRVAGTFGDGGVPETLGVVIVIICTLMVVIGLAYLVVNVLWIHRALRSPAPRLDELLK